MIFSFLFYIFSFVSEKTYAACCLCSSRTIKSRVVVLYKMMNPYYAGGLGIPYMMGMSGPGLFFPLFYTLAQG